jgi:hypothetical protein
MSTTRTSGSGPPRSSSLPAGSPRSTTRPAARPRARPMPARRPRCRRTAPQLLGRQAARVGKPRSRERPRLRAHRPELREPGRRERRPDRPSPTTPRGSHSRARPIGAAREPRPPQDPPGDARGLELERGPDRDAVPLGRAHCVLGRPAGFLGGSGDRGALLRWRDDRLRPQWRRPARLLPDCSSGVASRPPTTMTGTATGSTRRRSLFRCRRARRMPPSGRKARWCNFG